MSSSGLVAPSSRGGIFVLYFSHVLFPEPGSPVYHPEMPIKNEPLAVVFFRAVSMCPEWGQGLHAPLLHNQHCPPPRSCCRQLLCACGAALVLTPSGYAETGHSLVQE